MVVYFATYAVILSVFLLGTRALSISTWTSLPPSRRLRNRSLSSLFFFIAILGLILFVGLRSSAVGVDSPRYAAELYAVADGSFAPFQRQSLGYYAIEWIVANFFDCDYTVLFLMCATIAFCFLFAAIKRNSSNIFLSMVVFIAFGYATELMNQVREMMAVCVILYAFSCLKEGRKWSFSLWVLVAASFHITALAAFLMLFLDSVKLGPKIFMAAFVFLAVWIVALQPLKGLISHVPFFGGYVGSQFDTHASVSQMAYFAIRLAVFALIYSVFTRFDKGNKDQKLALNILFIGVVFYGMSLSMGILARVATYYIAIMVFALPNAISVLKPYLKFTGKVAAASFCLVVYVCIVLLKDYSAYSYQFFWGA